MSLKALSFFVLLSLLLGCTSVSPKKFSPVTEQTSYVLEEDVTYVALKANFMHPDVINGLAKGEYVAVFEDINHIYYVGEGRCVLPFNDRGGIALPKNGSLPRLWVYMNDAS